MFAGKLVHVKLVAGAGRLVDAAGLVPGDDGVLVEEAGSGPGATLG
jgi:hypothetical protein